MKVILVIDDDNGMMFNNRRQSQDRILREKILEISRESKLWMNAYSQKQFASATDQIQISDTFLEDAKEGEYCFVEDKHIGRYEEEIEELILYHWNRRYPGDLQLDFLPAEHGMHCVKREEFAGSSHDKITMEVWIR